MPANNCRINCLLQIDLQELKNQLSRFLQIFKSLFSVVILRIARPKSSVIETEFFATFTAVNHHGCFAVTQRQRLVPEFRRSEINQAVHLFLPLSFYIYRLSIKLYTHIIFLSIRNINRLLSQNKQASLYPKVRGIYLLPQASSY